MVRGPALSHAETCTQSEHVHGVLYGSEVHFLCTGRKRAKPAESDSDDFDDVSWVRL